MSDFWSNRKVLITGVSGFLGAWLARKLLEQGAAVAGLDLDPRGCLGAHGIAGDVDVIQGSVLDYDAVAAALRDNRTEVLFHLAGQAMIENAEARPLEAWELNARGSWIVMEACQQTPTLEAVAAASSNHTYGPQATRPYTEDMPFNQLDVYGASKACGDLVTRTYAAAYGLPAVAVRNTNSYGVADPHSSHIVTGTVLSVLRGERPVIRGDGTARKPYLYVEDTAEGYMLLGEHAMEDGVRGEAFNVTPAEPTSVLELVQTVLAVAGREDLEPEVLGEKRADTRHVEHLSGEKIKERLGWEPRFSLEEGVRRTLDWYREHGSVQHAAPVGSG